MHLWQFQPVRDLLIIAGIVGVLYLGYRASLVTVPLLLALGLAYLFEPLVQKLTRRAWFSRPGVAVAIIVAAFFIAVVPITVGVGTATVQGIRIARNIAADCTNVLQVVRFSRDTRESLRGDKYGVVTWKEPAPNVFVPVFEGLDDPGKADAKRAEAALAKLPPKLQTLVVTLIDKDHPRLKPKEGEPQPIRDSDMHTLLETSIIWVQEHSAAIGTTLGAKALGSGAGAVGTALRTFQSVAHLTLTLILAAFFFYFFSTGYGKVLAFWEGLIPERKKGRVIELVRQMDRAIAGFIRGRLTIVAVLMVCYTIAYWYIGVPAPLLIGPIVGAMSIVPLITILAIPVVSALMVLDPSPVAWQHAWWWIIGAPIGVHLIERAIDDYILTPTIMGKHTEMAFPTILFASLAGGALAGVYGLLIAIPVAACVRILLKEIFWPRFKAWAEGRERDFLPISSEQHALTPKED